MNLPFSQLKFSFWLDQSIIKVKAAILQKYILQIELHKLTAFDHCKAVMSSRKRDNFGKDESEPSEKNARVATSPSTSLSSAAPPKTINELPVEVLQKILAYAVGGPKTAGQLNASLVCWKWNQVVSESTEIVDNLRPKIVLRHSRNIENATKFKITRNYRELTLEDSTQPTEIHSTHPLIVMSAISNSTVAQHLRELTMDSLRLTPYIFGALLSLENLETLSMIDCTNESKTTDFDPVQLSKLNHLEFGCDDSESLLGWLDCKKLQYFKFYSERMNSHVVNFLNNLEKLDELIFDCRMDWDDDLDVALNPKFRWNKLDFEFPVDHDSEVAAASITALFNASSSTAEADVSVSTCVFVGDSPLLSRSVLDSLTACKKIKIMRISGDCPTIENMSSLRRMPELEKLTICINSDDVDDSDEVTAIDVLIEKFTGVREVILGEFCNSEVVMGMSRAMKLLTHLDISDVVNNLETLVHNEDVPVFKSIQSLTFSLVGSLNENLAESNTLRLEVGNLWQFCAANPTLTHLNMQTGADPSLMSFYESWLANKTSVRTCKLIV